MFCNYIVDLVGGMFFGWLFLFTSYGARERIQSMYSSIQDLAHSGERKPYQVVEDNNHTHFIFKKEVPEELLGKDNRLGVEGDTEAEIYKLRDIFRKQALLAKLSVPGNPTPKLELIHQERLEIFGTVEIRGVNSEKWLEGFAEFQDIIDKNN